MTLDAARCEALRRLALWRGAEVDSAQRTVIDYDTADQSLARRGLALSLERTPSGWVRRLDAAAPRRRWQAPHGLGFDFADVDDLALRQRLERKGLHHILRPVSEAQFRRTRWRLEPAPGVRLLATLDRGWIAAAGRRAGLVELLLELEAGTPADLHAFALRLCQRVPLYPQPHSRRILGRRLALGVAAAPVRAGAVDLRDCAEPRAAFARIALECLDQMQGNQVGAARGEDPEYVHQMRVATRRLRAALRMFRPVLPAAYAELVRGELGGLMAALGRTRDLDVLIAEIVAPVVEALPGEPRLADLMAVLTDRLYGARREAVARLTETRYALFQWRARGALLDVPVAAPAPEAAPEAAAVPPLREFAQRRLRRLLKAVRAAAAAARRDDPVSLHTLRIAIKRLRYGIEFFGPLAPAREVRALVARLVLMQDRLGQLNDLANAGEILMACAGRDTNLREAVTLIGGWHGKRHADLLAGVPKALARLDRLKLPKLR